ncbi:hypothetical protein QFC19_003344 [Naganishia cerealis]|uniref:Uncharacterized protein n=1 Tax=Naganishia cerealis TaxID=610337 RepID=A0ACC2W3N4_9TREE|nr:hypothetical protein QFC19_003344 [Naganishia cerealis]
MSHLEERPTKDLEPKALAATNTGPLALPAPPSEDDNKTRTLNVQEENKVALDELGPLIVNSDGNWQSLSDIEKERMMRLIVKRRNVQRLDKLKDQQDAEDQERESEPQ